MEKTAQQSDACSGEGSDVEVVGRSVLSGLTDTGQSPPTGFPWHCSPWQEPVLPRVDTELVGTRWGLGQDVNSVAGGIHVVEEVGRQGGEGKHQQPQHSQYRCHHHERGAEAAAAPGPPEPSEGSPGTAGGVEALGPQHDAVEEGRGGQVADATLETLHDVGPGDAVLKVVGKVSPDESFCLCERLVPTAAEEGDARGTQQCGDQGATRPPPPQTAQTAAVATHAWKEGCVHPSS